MLKQVVSVAAALSGGVVGVVLLDQVLLAER